MVLLPDEITNRDFPTVLGRGYDRREVDEFLTQVATSYKGAIEKIALVATGKQSIEDFSAELELILRPARESAEEMLRVAADKAAAMHNAAAQRAAQFEAEALERAKHIVEEAQETADRRLEEARLEIAREKQVIDRDLSERAAQVEASGPFTRGDEVLGTTFPSRSLPRREAGHYGRRRQKLTLAGFGKGLIIGLLVAEILYLLTLLL